jgi:hypothetical protein
VGRSPDDGDLAKGFYYRPTIFGDVEHEMRIAQEEIFGPTLSLIRFRDEAEAFRISNGIRYGLSSSIFTRDVNPAPSARCATSKPASRTSTRARSARRCTFPFGGVKETGNGHREAGQAALDVFTEWKSGLRRLLRNAPARADRQPVAHVGRVKLVWFVPADALEATRDGRLRGGGGPHRRVHALLLVHGRGTGTFLGGEGTVPAVGESGQEEHVAEVAVETVVPRGPHSRRRSSRSRSRTRTRAAVRRLPARRPVKASCSRRRLARQPRGRRRTAFVLEAEDGTVLDCARRGDRDRDEQRRRVLRRSSPASTAPLEARRRRARGRLRLGAPRQADARRVPRSRTGASQDLFLDASAVARKIDRVTYTGRRREHNVLADKLVNEALDAATLRE